MKQTVTNLRPVEPPAAQSPERAILADLIARRGQAEAELANLQGAAEKARREGWAVQGALRTARWKCFGTAGDPDFDPQDDEPVEPAQAIYERYQVDLMVGKATPEDAPPSPEEALQVFRDAEAAAAKVERIRNEIAGRIVSAERSVEIIDARIRDAVLLVVRTDPATQQAIDRFFAVRALFHEAASAMASIATVLPTSVVRDFAVTIQPDRALRSREWDASIEALATDADAPLPQIEG